MAELASVFLRLPLDHLLVTDAIYVVHQELCPQVDSDPMSIYIRIKVAI